MFSGTFTEQLQKLPPLSEVLKSKFPSPHPKWFHFDRILCYQTRGDLQAGARRGALDIGERIHEPELPRWVKVLHSDHHGICYCLWLIQSLTTLKCFFRNIFLRGPNTWMWLRILIIEWNLQISLSQKSVLLFDSLFEYLLFLHLPKVQSLPISFYYCVSWLLYVFQSTFSCLPYHHCPACLQLSGILSYTHILTQIIFFFDT